MIELVQDLRAINGLAKFEKMIILSAFWNLNALKKLKAHSQAIADWAQLYKWI